MARKRLPSVRSFATIRTHVREGAPLLGHFADARRTPCAAVVAAGEAVVGVAHLGRRPRAIQQTAPEWLYPTCAAAGCSTTSFSENDHRLEWAESHLTLFDLLDRRAPATTTSRPSTAGRWSRGAASGRSSRPTTPAIQVVLTIHRL